jgi:hypothetical protein
MGQRMLYEKGSQRLESLDPLGSNRYRSELIFHFFLTGFIWWLGFIVIVVAGVVLSLINRSLGTVVFVLAAVAWSIAMACAFWLHKLPGQLSEWKFAVDDKGQAAPIALDHVAWAFTRRNTPVDYCRVRRFPVMGQGSRDVLEVRQGIFYGLISCLASGNDLYIGWTFWLYLSPARWLLIHLRRFLWECRFQGHAIYVSLQFDRAKALREALHSAVREGVDVAAGQLPAQGHGTVGALVPVVADDSTNDPAWQWAGTT